jgi:hypothetical protein
MNDLYTGVAIVNTNPTGQIVALRLRDVNGTPIASTQLHLGPGCQVAGFVNQLFSAGVPPIFRGFLEMNSGADGIVAMGLLVRQGLLTSIPTSHYGQIKITP